MVAAQFELFIGNDLLYLATVLFCVAWQDQKYIIISEIIMGIALLFSDDVFCPTCGAAVVWCIAVVAVAAVALGS